MLDHEARADRHVAPLADREAAAMAWIADLFEVVLGIGGRAQRFVTEARRRVFVGRNVVNEAEYATRIEDTVRLGDELRYVRKMVRGDAAGDEVEAAVRKRQGLGICLFKAHIRNAAGFGELFGFSQHLVRSEERRVGKECRSRWSSHHSKHK